MNSSAFLLFNITAQLFQFACHDNNNDMCLFPLEYCDTGKDNYCKPCTRRVCDADRVPLQCKWNCTLESAKRTGEVEKLQAFALQYSNTVQSTTTAVTSSSANFVCSIPPWLSGIAFVFAFAGIVMTLVLLWKCLHNQRLKDIWSKCTNSHQTDKTEDPEVVVDLVKKDDDKNGHADDPSCCGHKLNHVNPQDRESGTSEMAIR